MLIQMEVKCREGWEERDALQKSHAKSNSYHGVTSRGEGILDRDECPLPTCLC